MALPDLLGLRASGFLGGPEKGSSKACMIRTAQGHKGITSNRK